jgi:hypothetical protein
MRFVSPGRFPTLGREIRAISTELQLDLQLFRQEQD